MAKENEDTRLGPGSRTLGELRDIAKQGFGIEQEEPKPPRGGRRKKSEPEERWWQEERMGSFAYRGDMDNPVKMPYRIDKDGIPYVKENMVWTRLDKLPDWERITLSDLFGSGQ